MARKSPTRATSTKSKRPARTTKSSSCPLQAARQRKFPPARAAIPRRFIRRTENTSPGVRKRAPDSKQINGGYSCKIDIQEIHVIWQKPLIDRLGVLRGYPTRREF